VATITVKNVPEELYTQLKAVAAANRRSINSEIIVCIERRLGSYRPDVDQVLHSARRVRELTTAYPITDKAFNEAKAAGRP